MVRCLVIAAHPDDEVLGCGGTIRKLVQGGCRVSVMILGEGMTSRYARRADVREQQRKMLRAASRRAAQILGVTELRLLSFPDNAFDTIPLLKIVKTIEAMISRIQPEIVFTHHGSDLNIDHRLTCQATLTATRPLKESPVKQVFTFPIPSSSEWAFQQLGGEFRPNTFFDISSQLHLKLQALQCYRTELRAFPHPRSLRAIEANARWWGAVAGLSAAEVFEVVRQVPNI